MAIHAFLTPSSVVPSLEAASKREVMRALAVMAARKAGVTERDAYSALVTREKQSCSGLGNGVCVPQLHLETITQASGIFVRLDEPVDFGAADGLPVDLLFLMLLPIEVEPASLKALALVTRSLRNRARLHDLRVAENADAIYRLLTQEEDELAA